MMFRIQKAAALLLAVIFCLSVFAFAGCGKDKGILLAKIGTEEFYSNDKEITDYQSYYYYVNEIDTSSGVMSDEFIDAYNMAVSTVILSHVYEKELAARGIALDEEAIRSTADIKKELLDKSYKGGFKRFCKDLDVSSDVLLAAQRYEAVSAKMIETVSADVTVSEQDIENHYLLNRESYAIRPGIVYDVILVEVTDLQDESENAAKKSEAQALLARVRGGEDFTAVQKEVVEKYKEDPYFYTGLVSARGELAYGALETVTDVEETTKAVLAEYQTLGITWDAKADKNTQAYENYVNCYLTSLYRIHLSYALFTATKAGEVYPELVPSPLGYVIVKNVSEQAESGYKDLASVHDEIEDMIKEQKIANAISSMTKDLCEKYEVEFQKITVQ